MSVTAVATTQVQDTNALSRDLRSTNTEELDTAAQQEGAWEWTAIRLCGKW